MMGSSSSGGDVEAGFAKLQGEDFEYYMQTYSIILGRNSKKSTVDVDLASLGGGMNISRHHARIFYDFRMRRFTLEVLGKNGCMVEGVLHLPGYPLVKLDSQDLLQIGDKKFYFLLPTRSILAGAGVSAGGSSSRHIPPPHMPATARLAPPPPPPPPLFVSKKKRPITHAHGDYLQDDDDAMDDDEEDDEEDEDEEEDNAATAAGMMPTSLSVSGKRMHRHMDGQDFGYAAPMLGKPGSSAQMEKKSEARSRADREADNHQLLQLEEKDVVSSVATVLSDLCGPGEWMPMAKLHSELVEQYGSIWHHGRVRRYLTSEESPLSESKGKPWFGLLTLLRKYPEHFVINTRSKGRVTSEFVSLVSLLS